MRRILAAITLLLLASPLQAQTREQADTLRVELVRTCGFAKGADTQLTKALAADSVTQDAQRVELVRSRGFVRGSITQCNKALALLDRMLGVTPPIGEPEPEPTPDPEPEPEPTPDPEPEPTDPGPALFADGFESGDLRSTANGFAWTNSRESVVSTERAFSGSRSLRMLYAPGGHVWAEQRFRLPNITPEIWLEYMLYVPANFAHAASSPNNNKLFSLWAGDYSTNRMVDTEVTMEYTRLSNGDSRMRCSVAHGDGDAREAGAHEDHDTQGVLFSAADRGTWVRIRVNARLAANGHVRVWKNDALVYELANWNLWGTGGINRFESGYLMGYDNARFAAQTVFYVDDFRVYTSNPGW